MGQWAAALNTRIKMQMSEQTVEDSIIQWNLCEVFLSCTVHTRCIKDTCRVINVWLLAHEEGVCAE